VKRKPVDGSTQWSTRKLGAALKGVAHDDRPRVAQACLEAASTGRLVLGKTAARHTSAEFVAFLTDIVMNQPRGKQIHVIADNLSAHKTERVEEFLECHRNVHLHFTPTYSSWLNQIELWFAKIERDVIARGVFTAVSDLKRKLMGYICHYNKVPKNREVEVLRSHSTYYSYISCYSPLSDFQQLTDLIERTNKRRSSGP